MDVSNKGQRNSFISKVKAGVVHTLSANVINKFISMISAMVVTRLLSQTDYGIWSYTINLFSYLVLISGFGLISGNMQFAAENKGEGKAYSYYRYCFSKGFLLDFGLIIIFGTVCQVITLPINESKPYILIYLPHLLLEYVLAIIQGILRSKNKIKEYAFLLNVDTIAIAICTCVGALFGITGLIIGRYLASAISLTVGYLKNKEYIGKIKTAERLSTSEKKGLWYFSLFTGASSAMNLLVYQLDITLIGAMIKEPTDVAIYRVGTLIPNALQFIPSSIVIAILPTILYHKNEVGWIRTNIKKVYLILIGFNIILVTGLMVFAPFIIRIVSGEQYLPAVPVFRVLSLGYFFSGTFRTLSVNLLASFRRVKYGLAISVVSCVSDIVLNYFLIKQYSMIGAAYATLVVDIITALMGSIYVVILLRKGTINEFLQETN